MPLQAAVTNVLSAAAAFGILTATFQWGWGTDLVGIDTARDTVPIASYVPLMMFAVLFGLSMDYEVFLVSHIQMHHLGGEPARKATASGLASAARTTTAACLIMTTVFASFINGDPAAPEGPAPEEPSARQPPAPLPVGRHAASEKQGPVDEG